MNEILKMMFEKEFFKRRIPLWHILIIASMAYAGNKLNKVETGVETANTSLREHGSRLDRIDDALYYKLDIDTSPLSRPAPTGTPIPRQRGSRPATNNIAQIQNQTRPP